MKLETLISKREESEAEYAALQTELERLCRIDWPPSYLMPGAIVDVHNSLDRAKRRLQIYKRRLRKLIAESEAHHD